MFRIGRGFGDFEFQLNTPLRDCAALPGFDPNLRLAPIAGRNVLLRFRIFVRQHIGQQPRIIEFVEVRFDGFLEELLRPRANTEAGAN